jgi:predicted metal-dependent HD superfamily phosphohydrolase
MEMINKLHHAMIKLYASDVKRIQHFCKVHSYAKLIGESEGLDERTQFILEAAALTHDIGIHISEEKYGDCSGKYQEKEGPALARKLLSELGFDKSVSERVQYLIGHHHTYTDIDGLDYQILVEADFLVNFYEDCVSHEAVEHAYNNIFQTETGRLICREMYGM